jgi:hypothetical protein
MKPKITDAQFIELFREVGAAGVARRLGIAKRYAFLRRANIEKKHRVSVKAPSLVPGPVPEERVGYQEYPHRVNLKVSDGVVLIAGDAHYWPGEPSIMHKAFVAFCKELKPRAIIFNGDVIDAPTISRHARIGWEERPDLAYEIENAKDRLHEIEKAAGRVERVWNAGNHDLRFETRISFVAPEYAKIHGVHLHDHFPLWRTAWSTWINDAVVVKHRFKGGIHAPHNNTLWAGKSIITGHLHSARVIPFSDYNGTRYGVDTGCIADTDAKAFVDYTEDSPKNWRSAFVVLTFRDGQLLLPELVLKWDNKQVQFRGKVIRI